MKVLDAISLHRAGRLAEAARAYDEILRNAPADIEALIYFAALRQQQGDADAAETFLRRALAITPQSVEARANLAAVLQAQGRHAAAIEAFVDVLARRPDLVEARFGLGASLEACGRDAEALDAYRSILAGDAAHPEANFGLARLLLRTQGVAEGIAHLRTAIAADPDFAEAHLDLGRLLASDAPHEAVQHFRQALDVDPDYHEARSALGNVLLRVQRDEDAIAEFRRVLAAEPDDITARLGLGTALDRKRLHSDAEVHYRAVLAAHPDHFDALAGLATAIKSLGRHGEAGALANRLLVQRPDSPAAISLLGAILAETGVIDQASQQFRRASALAPQRPEHAYYLVELAKVTRDDEVLGRLEAMQERIDEYAPQDRCLITFALAKAYDDIGERDRGFAMLLRGNAEKRAQTEYRETATLALLDRIARVFTPELLAVRAGCGDPSAMPIFVIGMPRSGTTLVEQILASHPAVFGAGERTDLSRVVGGLESREIGAACFPEAFWTVSADILRGLGSEYVAALRTLDCNALCIVDKMPANFAFAGLIRLILPNAHIIHIARDPVDTCLSCFSKLFAGEQAFSYELGELGRYYAAYRRLMAHWRAVLPPGFMLDVAYEELVVDFENQARRIVTHCDLPWDPACLEFHKGSRPVHTASLVQVRRPIYRSSIGRWRPATAILQPLLAGLGVKADDIGAAPTTLD